MVEFIINAWQTANTAEWINTILYGFAAAFAIAACQQARLLGRHDTGFFWIATAIALILFGLNEILDLQTLITIFGREHAKANGWYEDRRIIQYTAIIAVGIVTLAFTAWMAWRVRHMGGAIRLALVGHGMIVAYILMRGASFHHLDDIMGVGFSNFNLGWILEMAGICVVGLAAALSVSGRGLAKAAH